MVTIAVKNMHLWRSAFSDEEAFSRVWHQALLLPVWDAFFEARGGGEHENMLGAFVVPDGQETVGTTEATTAAWLDWYYGFESKVTNLSGGVIVGE